MRKCNLRPELTELVKFIREIYKTQSFVPLHEPKFNEAEKNMLAECIESTFVSNTGEYIDIVEQKLADFTGAKYAISTINGTSALHICLLLAGVKAQTEVLTQSLSFVATSNAIKYC